MEKKKPANCGRQGCFTSRGRGECGAGRSGAMRLEKTWGGRQVKSASCASHWQRGLQWVTLVTEPLAKILWEWNQKMAFTGGEWAQQKPLGTVRPSSQRAQHRVRRPTTVPGQPRLQRDPDSENNAKDQTQPRMVVHIFRSSARRKR